MRVYLLRFDSREVMNLAFGILLEADAVESSLVGPEPRELRFMAERADAEPLIQRIYLQGGLTWCSGQTPYPATPSSAQVG